MALDTTTTHPQPQPLSEQYELSRMNTTEDGRSTVAPAASASTIAVSAGASVKSGTEKLDAALQTALGPEPEDGQGANVQELAPVDRGVRAWTFCFCSFVLEMMIWGVCFSYGVFQNYYTTHPPFDTSSSVAIAAVGTIAIGMQYLLVFVISCIYGRYPEYMTLAMWGGLVLYFISTFGSSFATKVAHLILLQGVFFGIGGALLYVPTLKLLPEWFSQRRGLAGGIIFAGGGVGGFVFPFILNAMLDKLGFRWTLRIWSIVTTLISGIALLGIRPRLPVPKFSVGQSRPRFIPPRLGFIKSPLFWSFSVTFLLQGLSYFPVSLYITSFTEKLTTPLTAIIVTSIFNSSAVGGQIVLGHLSDRYPYPWVMFLSAIGSGAVAFLLWGLASSATQLYFFAIIFGAFSGGFSSTWANGAFDCARGRPEYTGLAMCASSVFRGISAIVGPIVSGLLLEVGHGSAIGGVFGREGYGSVEFFVGSCAIATGVGSVLVAFVSRRAGYLS